MSEKPTFELKWPERLMFDFSEWSLMALGLIVATVMIVAMADCAKATDAHTGEGAERAAQAEKAAAFYQGENAILERAYGPSPKAADSQVGKSEGGKE